MVPIKNGLFCKNWLFGGWLNRVSTVMSFSNSEVLSSPFAWESTFYSNPTGCAVFG